MLRLTVLQPEVREVNPSCEVETYDYLVVVNNRQDNERGPSVNDHLFGVDVRDGLATKLGVLVNQY